jgi:hypothetical protein
MTTPVTTPARLHARGRIASARAAADGGTLRAPRAGIVVGEPPRPHAVVEAGDEVSRLAASVRLIVGAGDVEGDAATCRVVLLDRPGVLLDGRLLPGVPDARSRTIEARRLPSRRAARDRRTRARSVVRVRRLTS